QCIDLMRVVDWRRTVPERPHQRIDVFELRKRLPSGVAMPPLAVRRQPDGERLGEVFVRVALRVPRVQMQHEALAVRLRRVELWIRFRGRAEDLASLASSTEAVGVVDDVAG